MEITLRNFLLEQKIIATVRQRSALGHKLTKELIKIDYNCNIVNESRYGWTYAVRLYPNSFLLDEKIMRIILDSCVHYTKLCQN